MQTEINPTLNLSSFNRHYYFLIQKSNFFLIRTMVIIYLLTIFMSLPQEGIPYFLFQNQFLCRSSPLSNNQSQEIDVNTNLKKCDIDEACSLNNNNAKRGLDYLLGISYEDQKIYESFITKYNIECEVNKTSFFPILYNLSSITGNLFGILLLLILSSKSIIVITIVLQLFLYLAMCFLDNLYIYYILFFLISQNYHLYITLITIYIAEFTLISSRSTYITILISMKSISGLMSLLMFYLNHSFLLSFKIYSSFLIPLLICFIFMCIDSIRYNLTLGQHIKALKDINYIAKVNNCVEDYEKFKEEEKNSLLNLINSNNSDKSISFSTSSSRDSISIKNLLKDNNQSNTHKEENQSNNVKLCSFKIFKIIILIAILKLIDYTIEEYIDLSLTSESIKISNRIIFYIFEGFLCYVSHFPMDIKIINRKGVLLISLICLICLIIQKYLFTFKIQLEWSLLIIRSFQVFYETTLLVYSTEAFNTFIRRKALFTCKIISRCIVTIYPFLFYKSETVSTSITLSLLILGIISIFIIKINESELTLNDTNPSHNNENIQQYKA